MDPTDLALINRMVPTHDGLRHLVAKHKQFETQLAELEAIRYPSEGELRQIGEIKRLKLRGKERISRILTQAR